MNELIYILFGLIIFYLIKIVSRLDKTIRLLERIYVKLRLKGDREK